MPSQHSERLQQNANSGKQKRKPVRRDPEKRRQQNNQAQRKYREKLRKRLENLEALAASAAHRQGVDIAPPDSSNVSTDIATSLTADDISEIYVSSSSVTALGACEHLFSLPDDTLSALDVWDPTTHVSQPNDTPLPLSIWGPTALSLPGGSVPSPLDIWSSTMDISPSNTGPSSSSPSIWSYPTYVSPLKNTSPTPNKWTCTTTHINPSLLNPDSHKSNNSLGHYWTSTINCGCPSPHFQIHTQGPAPQSFSNLTILRFEPSSTLPEPYANNLRIDTVCTIRALYRLTMHVGIPEEMMCAEDSLSPFFRPSAETSASADDTVKAVQDVFKTLKPDLRPRREQITLQHHPYIDVLPFPTLRKNLITHQEEVDEDEFFHDILNGLVCWGGSGVGEEGSTKFHWLCLDGDAVGRPQLGGEGVVSEEVLDFAWWGGWGACTAE